MSAFFTYSEVQTSFHVFENSLESIFVYDSDCCSNFCLKFMNSLWNTPVYNILYVSPEIIVTESQVWERADYEIGPPIPIHRPGSFLFKFSLISLAWCGAHHPIGRSCFLGSLEAWEAKNTEVFFCTYFLSNFRLQKIKVHSLLFRQFAPYHNWWVVLKRLVHLVQAFTSPDSAILLVCWFRQRKLAFIREKNSFQVPSIIS